MRLISWFLSQKTYCHYIEMPLIFVYWFFYPTTLLKLLIRFNFFFFFWLSLYIFLCIKSCHLQTEKISLLSSKFWYLFFISFIWLLSRTFSPIWIGVLRVGTIVLVLILGEDLSTTEYDVSRELVLYHLYCVAVCSFDA